MNYQQLNAALVKRMRVAVQSFVNDEWSKEVGHHSLTESIRWLTSMAVKYGLWHPDDDSKDIIWSKESPADVNKGASIIVFKFLNSQMKKAMKAMENEYIDIYTVCMILNDLVGQEDPLGKTMYIEPGHELAGVPRTYFNNYLMYQYLIDAGIMERHHFYVLMGHDAIDTLDSDGVNALIDEINNDGTFYDMTLFPDNYPPQLAIGNIDKEWIFITKEEYEALINLEYIKDDRPGEES